MPQSRKRKTRRGGPASRTTYSSKKQSNNTTKLVIYIIIIAIALGGLVYLLSIFGGGTGRSPNVSAVPGTEVTTPSGLKYTDEVIGTGEMPKVGQTVTVHYTGTLEDGTKFDSSRDNNEPLSTPIGVGVVVKGWDEGIMSMRVGGRRKLIVPPELGYGARGRSGIPPNATLYFDVELLGVK